MRKTVFLIFLTLTMLVVSLPAQDLVIPLPDGQGYAVKKETPNDRTRWELKILNQGGFGYSERTIINSESFYAYDFPPDMQDMEFDPTKEDSLVMDAAYFDRLKTVPIRRYMKTPDAEQTAVQVDAFLDAYNQRLRMAEQNEPVELIIETAIWQYWYNQISLWEQYIRKEVFLEPVVNTKLKGSLDFTSREALNEALAKFANGISDEAKEISRKENQRNIEMLLRLEQRDNRRKDYRQWLTDQRDDVIRFAENWQKKDQGRERVIDGTLYLLSEEPMEHVPMEAVNLVTKDLTPYDILNPDGTIIKPRQ